MAIFTSSGVVDCQDSDWWPFFTIFNFFPFFFIIFLLLWRSPVRIVMGDLIDLWSCSKLHCKLNLPLYQNTHKLHAKQDQALTSHVHQKTWPFNTQFRLDFWAPAAFWNSLNFVYPVLPHHHWWTTDFGNLSEYMKSSVNHFN